MMDALTKSLKQQRRLPDRTPVDVPGWLEDCANSLTGHACTLLWHTDAQTGAIDGFEVWTPAGRVADVHVGRK